MTGLMVSVAQEWLEGDGDYLAPELLTSEEPSFAADVYSAGATIYECCTGEPSPCALGSRSGPGTGRPNPPCHKESTRACSASSCRGKLN